MIPSTVNDVVFHHAHIGIEEVMHSATDTVTIGTMNAMVALLSILMKL